MRCTCICSSGGRISLAAANGAAPDALATWTPTERSKGAREGLAVGATWQPDSMGHDIIIIIITRTAVCPGQQIPKLGGGNLRTLASSWHSVMANRKDRSSSGSSRWSVLFLKDDDEAETHSCQTDRLIR
eukprot:jgi/Mesen1/10613/ME000088S10106